MHSFRYSWLGLSAVLALAPNSFSDAADRTRTAPNQLVTRTGDRSVVVRWNPPSGSEPTGYRVYRSQFEKGPFEQVSSPVLHSQSFVDFNVSNHTTYFYRVAAVQSGGAAPSASETIAATPDEFKSAGAFLDYVQQTAFDYFWYEAGPSTGLIRDRTKANSPCSIAAVGFGLTGIGIAVDHGWITRAEGRRRVLTTLQTFWDLPQGTGELAGGYRGFFYHFLDMKTGERVWKCELSSIDTALLMAGVLYVKQYFDGTNPLEAKIRALADALFRRVDWLWMTNGGPLLTMGWKTDTGFLASKWSGYNEAMILYIMAIGADTHPIPPAQWREWTKTYRWETHYGQTYVPFPPLFGHQYSHCWIDFRGIADDYMTAKGITYFENSRRATYAQQAYCAANPNRFAGYSSKVWGLTACDGPGTKGFFAYRARGAPPEENDDGTIAPTAPGGSIAFAPELCLPTLRHFYDRFRTNLWTTYGFRDAFNLQANWWDPDVLGIDQGPILLMIENYRTQNVWRRFMQNPEIQRGLERAGFRKPDQPSC